MKKGFRALCLMVFGIGILSFSLAWEKSKSDVEPSRPFVAVYYQAHATPDGKRTITSWRTRYVKANGEWKVVAHGSDAIAAFAYDAAGASGTSSTVLAGTAEGVFVKPSGATERKSLGSASTEKSWDSSVPEMLDKKFHSHSFLRNHPEFVRMDKVAGLEVYVLRWVSEDNQNFWVEDSYSPLTGRNPLRILSHELDGSEYMIEAVKVEFRDLPDNLNDDIQSLPNTGHLGDKTTPPKQ
ncbi:MAG: hypothetical protein V7641_846 [Blastocatellia bacterium]